MEGAEAMAKEGEKSKGRSKERKVQRKEQMTEWKHLFDLQSARTLGKRLPTTSEPSSESSIPATAANTTTFGNRFSSKCINTGHHCTSSFSISLNAVNRNSAQSL